MEGEFSVFECCVGKFWHIKVLSSSFSKLQFDFIKSHGKGNGDIPLNINFSAGWRYMVSFMLQPLYLLRSTH
jgi:hypothetical protein